MGVKHSVEEIFNQAAKFVVKQKGEWNHSDWENFLEKISGFQIDLNDELVVKLGSLLELGKYLYQNLPETLDKKSKKAKKKKSEEKETLEEGS